MWFQDVPCKWGCASWILFWIYCLHLLLPAEREGEGQREREGREHLQFIPQAILSLFLENKWAWWQTDRQTGQLVRQCDSQSWSEPELTAEIALCWTKTKKVRRSCRISMQTYPKQKSVAMNCVICFSQGLNIKYKNSKVCWKCVTKTNSSPTTWFQTESVECCSSVSRTVTQSQNDIQSTSPPGDWQFGSWPGR